MALFHTGVERAICGTRKLWNTQVASHWRGPHLLNIIVLAVADGLFGLYGSEHRDELPDTPHPPTHRRPPFLISRMWLL